MTAGPRTDSTTLPAAPRALRSWMVGVLVVLLLLAVTVLAWSRVSPGDQASSRTITDIELEDDVTIRPVPDARPAFRPVLRTVPDEPTPRAISNRGTVPAAGDPTRPDRGGTTVRPNDGGGGGTVKPPTGGTKTPVVPIPDPVVPTPAVPVVTLPPTAVGPIDIPPQAVGPQSVGPLVVDARTPGVSVSIAADGSVSTSLGETTVSVSAG